MSAVALIAAALLLGVAGFQAGLAGGAPWGAASYGGRAATDDGRLPMPMRVMSGIAVVILVLAPLFGIVIERRIIRLLEGTSEITKLFVPIVIFVFLIVLNIKQLHPKKMKATTREYRRLFSLLFS